MTFQHGWRTAPHLSAQCGVSIKPQEGRNKSITITGANDSTAVVMPNHPRDFSVLCADCDDRPPRGSNSAHFASDDEALELRL